MAIGDNLPRAFQELLLPGRDLIGTNLVLLRQFSQGLVATDRLKGASGLELWRIVSTGSFHLPAPLFAKNKAVHPLMHIAVPVHGVPKIMPVDTDRNKRLIKVPRVAETPPSTPNHWRSADPIWATAGAHFEPSVQYLWM